MIACLLLQPSECALNHPECTFIIILNVHSRTYTKYTITLVCVLLTSDSMQHIILVWYHRGKAGRQAGKSRQIPAHVRSRDPANKLSLRYDHDRNSAQTGGARPYSRNSLYVTLLKF